MDRLRGKIAEMAVLGERALRQCVDALVRGDRQLAYAVILRDLFIDEQEKEIDRLCLEFLVRRQPVAQPLRFAFAAIKIDLELERVGDYAESIARQIVKLVQMEAVFPAESFVGIADMAIPMLRDAVQAFTQGDAGLARSVIEREEAVDLQKRSMNAALVTLFKENKITLEALNALSTIARRFERVSDQARNIAVEALYVCTGHYAKHGSGDAFRILFVDEFGSCRSQIAEAIASGLKVPRFEFASAGMDPRAVDPVTAEYLRSMGADPARAIPRAVVQVPDLDRYHVIAFLSPGAKRAFPQRPMKRIFLEWFVDDPSQAAGTPEEVRAGYDRTRRTLEGHIRDLVDAILGKEQMKLKGL